MHYMVFFERERLEILHTLTGRNVFVKKKDLGEFIDMLMEAQRLVNEKTLREIAICQRTSWLKNTGAVFESDLVGAGLVIPVQKQAEDR